MPTRYQLASPLITLASNGIRLTSITLAAANAAVANKYGNPNVQEAFGGTNAWQLTWSSAYNALLNGSGTPSVSTLASNPDTLVRFSTTAAGAQSGYWWTSVGSVVDNEGNLLSPAQIQQILALPSTPNFMAIGGAIPTGSSVIIGEAAGNSFGAGGAWQVLSEVAATAEGDVVQLVQLAGESGLSKGRKTGSRVIPITSIRVPM